MVPKDPVVWEEAGRVLRVKQLERLRDQRILDCFVSRDLRLQGLAREPDTTTGKLQSIMTDA